MKIAHVCNLFVVPEHPQEAPVYAHPGRWVLNLALAQQRHTGIEPELYVPVPGTTVDFDTTVEGIPVHYLANPGRYRAVTLFHFAVRPIAERLRHDGPELVHAHGTEDAHGIAAQRSGRPYVLTAQGVHCLINRIVKPGLIDRRRIVAVTERRCLRRCRDVIAKSDYVGEALAAEFPHLSIHRIPNTFDARLLDVSAGAKEQDLIAFVGSLVPRKGVHLLCEALEKLEREGRAPRLWVFGDRSEMTTPYEDEQKRRLEGLLGDRVEFRGRIAALELAREVAKAKALVAPSLEEMFGNQLVEALLVRTHGIVTDETAMAENVRRFGNGTIVPQGDVSALAEAIRGALGRDNVGEAERARAAVTEAFGPERVALMHEEVYRKTLARRE